MKYQPGRRNLICVLDWGIGHASRSLALARQLVEQGETVNFAAAGNALLMLKAEWKHPAEFFSLRAYDVDYRSSKMHLNVGRQLPKIFRAVYQEHQQLKTILAQRPHDRIISDSRFGCYAKTIPSVMMTHQLYPIFGVPLAGWVYRNYLRRYFSEFWVPDYAPPKNLSGALSSSAGYETVAYIGPLSRLEKTGVEVPKQYDYGCLLSGPEPQRTYLEEALIQKLNSIPGRHWLVAGQPGQTGRKMLVHTPNVSIERIGFSPALETALLLRQSKKIICRSGYSTLMDLDKLGIEKVLLIPTPGQTEQQYLAQRWADLDRANWVSQSDLGDLQLS